MASSKLSKEQQLFHSLVKYDTPYLVSTTVNNKKAIEELSQDTEKTNSILRSVFFRNKNISYFIMFHSYKIYQMSGRK